MRNLKGFIPIVVITVIAILASTMVGVSWYYNQHKDELITTSNTLTTVEGGCFLSDPQAEETVKELSSVSIECTHSIDPESITEETFFALQGIDEKIPSTITLDSIDGLKNNGATLTFNEIFIPDEEGLVLAVTVVIRNSEIKTALGQSFVSDEEEIAQNIYIYDGVFIDISQLVPADNPDFFFAMERIKNPYPNLFVWSSVAFKGEEALIGGNSRTLVKYDGDVLTDLSELVQQEETTSDPRVDFIAANDEYWLIFVYGSNYEHFYKYDGTTITEITLPTVQSSWSHILQDAVWTGNYWLISFGNYLWKFDGQNFTQIDSLFDDNQPANSTDIAWGGNKAAIVVRESNTQSKIYFYENDQLSGYTSLSGLITHVTYENGLWLFTGTDNNITELIHNVYVLNGDDVVDYSDVVNEAKETLGALNIILDVAWWKDYWVICLSDSVVRATADFSTIERVRTSGGRWWGHMDVTTDYGLVVGQKVLSKLVEKQETYHLYANDWQNYRIWWSGDKQLYHFISETEKVKLDLGFNMEDYNFRATPKGLLFWKKSPQHTAVLDSWGEDEEITYETGGDTILKWYDFESSKLRDLPILELQEGNFEFERIYSVVLSNSENKVLFEIGKYNAHASAFAPGMIGAQPVITYGKVFNLDTNQYEDGDPITVYHDLLGSTNTTFVSILWDSNNNVIMGAPGGEGCGAYGSIYYVDLEAKTYQKIDGAKELSFDDESACNPTHSIGDSKYIILYGVENKKMNFYVYATDGGPVPIKYLAGVDVSLSENVFNFPRVKSWQNENGNISFTLEDDTIIEFSEMMDGSPRGSIAPAFESVEPYAFDACPGLSGYSSNDWYSKMVEGLDRYSVKPADVTDACRSLDGKKVIMLVPSSDSCKGINIYMYTVSAYNSSWVQKIDLLTNGVSCMKPATQFGKRVEDIIPIEADTCTTYQYHYLNRYFTAQEDGAGC